MAPIFGEQQMSFTPPSKSGVTLWASGVSSKNCSTLDRCLAVPLIVLTQKAPFVLRALLLALALIAMAVVAPVVVAQKVQLSVDVSKASTKIDRNIFGQSAEHLGHGIYEGIWVGPDSTIPNTRGIRNDVVAALKAIQVPNVRWPGGCFADEYHWRNGVGPQRVVTLNPNWGGVPIENCLTRGVQSANLRTS
jgi:hypothetical protein